MAYSILGPTIIPQPIAEISTVKKVPLGRVVQAEDPVYGVGEFIYLQGVASTVLGSWSHYHADDWSTTLTVPNAIGPVCVAMAACVASNYGWYQIAGKAVGKCSASYADNGLVWMTATPGEVDDAVADGDLVHLAKGASAIGTPAAGLAEFEISRPYTDDIATND